MGPALRTGLTGTVFLTSLTTCKSPPAKRGGRSDDLSNKAKQIVVPADVRLEGPDGQFSFFQPAWERALTMAYEYGWEPEHTLSVYMADVGLVVTSDDADGLAEAIEAAIADAEDARDRDQTTGLLGEGELLLKTRERWEGFITFCHVGGFRVVACGSPAA